MRFSPMRATGCKALPTRSAARIKAVAPRSTVAHIRCRSKLVVPKAAASIGGGGGGSIKGPGGGGGGGGDGGGGGGPEDAGASGLRERLLADPNFSAKMAIECGIGVCTKLTAEKTKREDNFMSEIDFVAANVVMAIIADWMLTWLPAPALSFSARRAANNPLAKMFAGCPENAFQKVQPGREPFTLGQRSLAIVNNGLKLLGVGFGASMLGVGMTNALVQMRMFLDPSWAGPPNPPQNVVATSAAYGVYMAVSSNLRYQVIAGVVEQRGIETIFAGNHRMCTILSFIARTGNTFLGSLLWVDFVRLLGMQKAKEKVIEEPVVVKGKKK
eukprot:gene14341-20334_t